MLKGNPDGQLIQVTNIYSINSMAAPFFYVGAVSMWLFVQALLACTPFLD
jgi:hypothetical protein